jgi:curved DNA-binding protein CbpA
MGTQTIDYYEFLQISPHADADTIHRVYRYLAARLHPDNHVTGHAESFRLLRAAYDVLSDPERRAEYDATRNHSAPQPLSTTLDFMDSLEGELNRRLAVLAVLYSRRRTSPNLPEVSLAEIEERMGFPRDFLDFTLWYLQKKGYIAKTDNAQYTLTVDGVDFVEKQRGSTPTLNNLLTSGSGSSVAEVVREQAVEATDRTLVEPRARRRTDNATGPIILPSSAEYLADRRAGKPDRRVGMPDLRVIKVERRGTVRDRRTNTAGRRSSD